MKKLLVIAVILSLFIVACSGGAPTVPPSTAPTPSAAPVPQQEAPVVEKQGDTKGVSAGGEDASVVIKGFKFVPADLKIKKGTTVTWRNEDGAAHTVESSDSNNKVLLSDDLSDGDTFTHTFDDVGSFNYLCGIHRSMKGTVTVE